MEKLALNLDELTVESFESTEATEEKGTVQGQDAIASNLNSCWDTLCGKTYCISSPCVC